MTTKIDVEVEQNKNSDELLTEFQELWESHFPLAAELEAANSSKAGPASPSIPNHATQVSEMHNYATTESLSCASSSDRSLVSQQHSTNEDQQNSTYPEQMDNSADDIQLGNFKETRDAPERADKNANGKDDENSTSGEDVSEEDRLCPLRQLSIRAENESWREFQLHLQAEDLFDFIFADPQQSISASELKERLWTEFKDERKIVEFANFCYVSLRPGCYAFVLMTAAEHEKWVSAFQKQGMKVMSSPFLVIPSQGSALVTRLKDLPQPIGELAVVARTPGSCPGFKINFNGPYSRIDCSHTRKFGIIDNVPRCVNPLRGHKSRAEVRPRERDPDFISEVIDTFCPPTGLVLDPFAGALTSGPDCIATQRKCVILEKDPYCFDLAIRRLEKLCRDHLLNCDVESSDDLVVTVEEGV